MVRGVRALMGVCSGWIDITRKIFDPYASQCFLNEFRDIPDDDLAFAIQDLDGIL